MSAAKKPRPPAKAKTKASTRTPTRAKPGAKAAPKAATRTATQATSARRRASPAKPARRAPSPLVTGTRGADRGPVRLSANPEDVERSVVQLVLTLVEFLRELMERQAIRRVDVGDLDDDQVEAVGQSLMILEKTVAKIAKRFDLKPEELDLDLGPLGRLRG